MACKFQIGDTVQVVKCADPEGFPLGQGFKIGHRGTVIAYDPDNAPYCYEVKRKNDNMNNFSTRELKLIKRKTKTKKK